MLFWPGAGTCCPSTLTTWALLRLLSVFLRVFYINRGALTLDYIAVYVGVFFFIL